MKFPFRATPVVIVPLLVLACSGGVAPSPEGSEPLVVYSGRAETLLGPLIERFDETSDVEVRVRYADTAELAATLMEEGDASPAHVFVSQDAAALGALADRGRLRPLPAELLALVPESYRGAGGEWVGLSGRVRAVAYNPALIAPDELPTKLSEVAAGRRFGVAPTNGSFQAHLAAYRTLKGEEALRQLLDALVAADPGRYPKNSAIVNAVAAGEIGWGLVNHYYVLRALAEDPDAEVALFYMPGGEDEASTFVNVAGAGVLTEHPEAEAFVRHLLSPESQRFFAEETFEYPLVAGIVLGEGLVPLEDLRAPVLDFASVASALEPTLAAIFESGLVE